MTHHAAVQRTAPIAIAPKPPRPEPATTPYSQQQHRDSLNLNLNLSSLHNGRFDLGQGPGSLHAAASRASLNGTADSSLSASPAHGALPRPCQACRYAGSKCAMGDDDDGCIPCQVTGSECSLSVSPQSRKRKLNGESADETGKRRSVSLTL